MTIRRIKREDIDKVKWDSCIHYANNGTLFGYTWYLDQVGKDWEGLVEGDYESVFPLIRQEKKWGVTSLFVPELLPQSGLFSIHVLSKTRIEKFMEAIPDEYGIREFRFNEGIGATALSNFSVDSHHNYHLLLKEGWEKIVKNYSPELLDVLQDKSFQKFSVDSSISPEVLTDFYLENHPNAKEEYKHTYLRIIYNLMHRGTGFVTSMRNEKEELIAANYFAFSHGKVISLIPTWKGDMGKKSLWKLTDMLIQSQANNPVKFDFNIAMGNLGVEHFGAKKTTFYGIKENRLSGIKKWLVR